MTATWRILEGDCRESLRTLDARSVQTCVTSPPYFGLRDYGHDGQIGLEPTPDEFVAALVGVFREVRRVLRDDGTVWLNLGDSYASNGERGNGGNGGLKDVLCARGAGGTMVPAGGKKREELGGSRLGRLDHGVKAKDLLGIPWMVAFALRADGWYLRSDIIWAKPNPMPESVTDRPTKAHEYLFLLSKGPRYFYDADAIREEHDTAETDGRNRPDFEIGRERNRGGRTDGYTSGTTPLGWNASGRNKRSVWTVATQPYPGAHFATFPPKLIEPCILAGSVAAGSYREVPLGGRVDIDPCRSVVLDPFAGAGTTGMVALRHGRSFVGCELNADYVRLARDRIIADSPLLNTYAEAA